MMTAAALANIHIMKSLNLTNLFNRENSLQIIRGNWFQVWSAQPILQTLFRRSGTKILIGLGCCYRYFR